MLLRHLRRRFLLSLGFSVAVLAGLAVYGDAVQMAGVLASFPWVLTPAILGLTLVNYLLRFVKWQFYLGQIGVEGLSRRDSFLIFFSGLAMVVTPGKVGEWLKSYLLRELAGVPFSRSAPIILAERLTDGLAMVLLASGGVFLFAVGWQVVAVALALASLVLALVWYRPLADALVARAARLGPLRDRAHHLHALHAATRTVLSPRNLTLGVALGFLSWGAECLAFWLVLQGLGLEGSGLLVVQAAFILAAATLGGALFITPGGLGVAEGSIVGLCQLLLAMSPELAATGALLIRLSTLWFGVGVGLAALAVISRRIPSVDGDATAGEIRSPDWPAADPSSRPEAERELR